MGIGRRILDLARANLNALMDRASREQLDGLSERELEAELERRRQERSAQEQERVRRVAEEAAAKSRGSKREKTERSEQREPRTRGAARRASEAEVRAARERTLYKTLGVRHGAPIDEVKRAYRALMREHHPDKHSGNPAQQKAASNRAATITTAYAELEVLIIAKRR